MLRSPLHLDHTFAIVSPELCSVTVILPHGARLHLYVSPLILWLFKGPPASLIIKKMQLPTHQSNGVIFSVEAPSFQMTLACVKLTKNQTRTMGFFLLLCLQSLSVFLCLAYSEPSKHFITDSEHQEGC